MKTIALSYHAISTVNDPDGYAWDHPTVRIYCANDHGQDWEAPQAAERLWEGTLPLARLVSRVQGDRRIELTAEQRRRVVELLEGYRWGDFARLEEFATAMLRVWAALEPWYTGGTATFLPPPSARVEWGEGSAYNAFAVSPDDVSGLSSYARLDYVAELVHAALLAYDDAIADLVHDLRRVILEGRPRQYPDP